MGVEEVILAILGFVVNAVGWLLGLLPNPDPFPTIIDNMTIQGDEPWVVAWYWLSQFVNVPFVISVIGLFFSVFAIGWLIQMLWKWIKAR